MELKAAHNLMQELKEKHNLHDWKFTFDRSVRRFGLCNFKKKTISLSYKLTLINNELQVRETTLHEIAHALVGRHNHHNNVWKQKALLIGSNGERCYSNINVITPKKKYKGICPGCKKTVFSHRLKYVSCGKCSGKFFNINFLIKWNLNKEG